MFYLYFSQLNKEVFFYQCLNMSLHIQRCFHNFYLWNNKKCHICLKMTGIIISCMFKVYSQIAWPSAWPFNDNVSKPTFSSSQLNIIPTEWKCVRVNQDEAMSYEWGIFGLCFSNINELKLYLENGYAEDIIIKAIINKIGNIMIEQACHDFLYILPRVIKACAVNLRNEWKNAKEVMDASHIADE